MIAIPRDEDVGLRLAEFQLVADGGVLFMTERSLMRFDSQMLCAWRVDDDFSGWAFDRVVHGRIGLAASNWAGQESFQSRSLADGHRLGVKRAREDSPAR